MASLTIRQKLMTYLAHADDSKVQAVYTLLERDIEDEVAYELNDEQYQILEDEEAKYLRGEGRSYTREEADQIAKGLRDL